MNPTRLMTLPCELIVVTAGAVDEYNNPTDTETTVETTCWLHQSQRREADGGGAETQDETWQVYLPPDVPADGWSRLEAQGMTFELIGPPWLAWNPRLEESTHIQATARRTV